MDSAAKKLKSSRGASMVLALVFLLVCVMVGSSVLMAAASNGGRSRSNRQEQQMYLVLSSALQLVADDLNGAEYTCKVNYEHQTMPDPPGGTYRIHRFTPHDGEMVREDGSKPMFAEVFRPALDSISKGSIAVILEKLDADMGSAWEELGDHYYYLDFTSVPSEPQSFTLTVTPTTTGPLAGYTAKVAVTIDTNYRITLTAWMTGAPDTKALELFKNYYLTVTLTRSGGITSLEIPEMTGDGTEVIQAGTISWKAGKVIREYRDPEAGP